MVLDEESNHKHRLSKSSKPSSSGASRLTMGSSTNKDSISKRRKRRQTRLIGHREHDEEANNNTASPNEADDEKVEASDLRRDRYLETELPGAIRVPGINHQESLSIMSISSHNGEESLLTVTNTTKTTAAAAATTTEVIAELAPDFEGVVAEREALKQKLAKKEQELQNQHVVLNVVQAEVIEMVESNKEMDSRTRLNSKKCKWMAAAAALLIAVIAVVVVLARQPKGPEETDPPTTMSPTGSSTRFASSIVPSASPTESPTRRQIQWKDRGSATTLNGFAESISSDGTMLAVSSLDRFNVSHITVYEYIEEDDDGNSGDGSWIQVGEPVPGHVSSLSNDGTILAVGVTVPSSNVATFDTFVVYQLITTSEQGAEEGGSSNTLNKVWSPLGHVDNDESIAWYAGPLEEISLTGDGKNVALGYPTYDIDIWGQIDDQIGATYAAGLTQVFQLSWDDESWIQVGTDIVGTGCEGYAGAGISLAAPTYNNGNWDEVDDGLILAIGSPSYNPEFGLLYGPGQVRVFQFKTGGIDWEQLGQSLNGNVYDGPSFGESVVLCKDGMVLAVGAVGGADNNGYVRVFRRFHDDDVWHQIGNDLGIASILLNDDEEEVNQYNNDNNFEEITGQEMYDNFGRSVALSYDGSRLAVSYERIPSTIGERKRMIRGRRQLSRDQFDFGRGEFPTYVSLYEYDQVRDEWVSIGDEIPNGEYSLLSSNGQVVVATSTDEQVRVYQQA